MGRFAHAGDDLVAVELLAGVVLLDDGDAAQLHLLKGGEAVAAGLALAATADAGGVGPRVDDAGVGVAAERAVHGFNRLTLALQNSQSPRKTATPPPPGGALSTIALDVGSVKGVT